MKVNAVVAVDVIAVVVNVHHGPRAQTVTHRLRAPMRLWPIWLRQ